MRPSRHAFVVEALERRRLFVGSTFEFLSAAQTVANNAGTVEVFVQRGGDTSGYVAVNYYTTDGTAAAGTDYTSSSGGVYFDPGETTESILITLGDRPSAPAAQDFTVTLWAPSAGGSLGPTTLHTVTLQNDRAPVTLAAATYTKTTDDMTVSVVVTRSGNTTVPVTVDYSTGDGSASAGVDYTAASGTLSFAMGETSKNVNVQLLGNRHAPGGANFGFALFNPLGGAVLLGTSSATVSIANAYAPVQFNAASYTGTTDDSSLSITVTRTGNATLAASVQYASTDGTATAGVDYGAVSGTFTFAAGQTSKQFSLPLAGNVEASGDRGLTLALSSFGGAAVAGSVVSANVTIENPYSPLRFAAATYNVSTDDATATLAVNRTGNTAVAATVDYATSDLTAVAGVDYTAASGTLSFATGEATKTIVVPLLSRFASANGLLFDVALSGGGGGAVLEAPAEAIVTIANSHATIRLDASFYTFSTDDAVATLVVNRDGNTDGAVSVQYATSDGSAEAGTDYTAASGTLNFAAGDTQEVITIPLLGNFAATGSVVFDMTLSTPGGAGAELGAIGSAAVTIVNDHSLVQVDASTYVVDVRLGIATIAVTAVGNSSLVGAVDFATSDGTAVDGEDYFGTSGTLVFGPGQMTQLVEISILGGAFSPASRSFSLVLSAPAGSAVIGARDTAAVDIQNVESLVQFSATTYSVLADVGTATLTLTRVGNTSLPVTIDYATADGTALDGRDYAAGAATVSLAGGQTTRTIEVPVFVYAAGPAGVAFTVSLLNPSGAVIGSAGSAAVTVENIYTIVEVDAPAYGATTDDAAVGVLVRRTGNTSLAGAIAYTTFSEAAFAGEDYAAAAGILSFAPGEVTKAIPITLLGNVRAGGDRVFGVSISGGTGSAIVGAGDTSRVTVSNIHSVVGFAPATYAAGESAGFITFSLSRVGNLGQSVSVGFATADGTATAGADYAAAVGTVTFNTGEATATFSVPVHSDLEFDPNETFGVSLVDPAGGAVLGSAGSAVVTLADTTPPPTFAGGGLVSTQRSGRLDGVSLSFDQALDEAPSSAAFSLFQRSGDGPGGVARLKPVAIAAAFYNPATHAVTVTPTRALKSNVFYQLSVDSLQIRNAGGKQLDGAGTGVEGSPLVVTFGRGRKLKYVDRDGDAVQFSLKGPGVIELVRRADGEGDVLALAGTTAVTKLLGVVRRGRLGGDGRTTLASVVGLGAATSLLSASQFDVGPTV